MMGGDMMGGGMWPFTFGWMMLGWALVIAVLAAVVIAVVWILRRVGGPSRPMDSPLDILKRRYAQGELTPEQFEQMKRHLTESR